MSWQRLIKFEDAQGKVHYGEPFVDGKVTATTEDLLQRSSLKAKCYSGSSPFSLGATDQVADVKKILPLLDSDDVPIIKCIGLNYTKHSKLPPLLGCLFMERLPDGWRSVQESGRRPPPFPSVFIKPRASVASYNEDIPIPKLAHETLDYEGELSIVIGKSGKDISKDHALDHVAGFVTSNDVSCRKWQRDPAYAGVAPQWCFSKGFDKFAVLGPVLVSPNLVGTAGNLGLQTFVNGDLRQQSNTNDLLFDVETIISFVSQGTTLERGTVIMTGTPDGVAMGMKEPLWLKDGDVVEVKIESLGSVKNRMTFT